MVHLLMSTAARAEAERENRRNNRRSAQDNKRILGGWRRELGGPLRLVPEPPQCARPGPPSVRSSRAGASHAEEISPAGSPCDSIRLAYLSRPDASSYQ